jgi:hypothetical protein
MRKLRHLFALSLFGLLSMLAIAQKNTISGKITDEKGEPVPFATITIKGTHRSVSADASGNFTLVSPKGTILLISATGFGTKEVTAQDSGVAYSLVSRNNLQ